MITKTINDECECPFMHKIYVGSAKICFIYCALNSSGVYCGYMLELVFVDWYRKYNLCKISPPPPPQVRHARLFVKM